MATSNPVPEELAGIVREAAAAAAVRLPSPRSLTAGKPQIGLDGLTLPAGASAVTAGIQGAMSGAMVLVLSAEVVAALTEAAPGETGLLGAVAPALEAGSGRLGEVALDATRELPADLALGGLAEHPIVVAVPLQAEGATLAIFLVGADLPAQRARHPAPPQARPALDMLRDVELEVTVELGRTRLSVRELLSMAPGTLVELDRAAGSPADLLVNGTLMARGEVVVIDEDFGLRITEIVGAEAALTVGTE